MDLSDFEVNHLLRIDWSELDYFKHVNNVSFFKYIQSARVNYWEQLGLIRSHLDTNIGAMLVSTQCDFKKPLFYPGNVTVFTKTIFIKTTSFGFQHLLLNSENEIAAEAQDVMVTFDFAKNEKVPVPAWLQETIALRKAERNGL